METKMEARNLMGFFLVIASILLIATTISAANLAKTDSIKVEVNGFELNENVTDVSIIAGDTISVKVAFTADEDDTSVRLKAELEGETESSRAVSSVFDVEAGKRYVKAVTLDVPYELEDTQSEDISLNIEIDGAEHKTEAEYTLTVQRPSFNLDFLSMNTPQTIEAGDLIAVDVILRNIGYNDLEDLSLTVKIPALEIEESVFVGDLVAFENDDEEDTLNARVFVEIPFNAEAGLYALEVEASNDDFVMSETKQISVSNNFASNVVALEQRKSFAVGEEASYSLLIVNPTDSIKLYRVISESDTMSVKSSATMVAVPADESKSVEVFASAVSEGEHTITVNVFSGDKLTGSETLNASVQGGAADAVVVLTIVLAIIFIVLLIVLIVLLRKKPEKEEFGESYY